MYQAAFMNQHAYMNPMSARPENFRQPAMPTSTPAQASYANDTSKTGQNKERKNEIKFD